MEELQASCLLLNPYSVEARYPATTLPPEESGGPDELKGKRAAEAADRVFNAVLRRLPSAQGAPG